MDEASLLRRQLEREKRARKEAEVFIEAKSLELFLSREEQKRAFAALQEQADIVNAANAQLQLEIGRRLQAESIERLLERIVKQAPLESILEDMASMAEQQASSGRCFIVTDHDKRLFQAQNGEFSPEISDGADPGIVTELLQPWSAISHSVQVIEDTTRDRYWKPHQASGALAGLESCWVLPLVTRDGEQIGTFSLHHSQARSPDDSDIKLMQMLSGLAAMAIRHRQLADTLRHQAHYDTLTDLPNRLLFRDRLEQAVAHAARDGLFVGVLFLDLDGFKQINDTLGHKLGDKVLQEVARRLKRRLRRSDTLARMGGDEFMVVLPSLKAPANAAKLAQQCLNILRKPMRLEGHELFVGASIGISVFPEHAQSVDELQRQADVAMYAVKQGGKNAFHFYTPNLSMHSLESLDLRSHLHRALESKQFELHYQPQFWRDGRLRGLEALLRWNHPELGMVPPGKFISIAEESGLIVPIGEWVLQEACRQMAAWLRTGSQDLIISVNVSNIQFERATWLETVGQALAQSGLEPSLLELELTESVVMHDVMAAAAILEKLRKLGVRIAIDDFGTGFSSLTSLQHLPVDTLKIDQSFVREIDRVPLAESKSAIIRTIIVLGHELGLQLVAEGVETKSQADFLRDLECDALQGYLLGKPMPAYVCNDYLRNSGWNQIPRDSQVTPLVTGTAFDSR